MKHLRLAAALLALAVLPSCTAEPAETATTAAPILQGQSATVGQFPQVVAIFNRGLCTGTLVAPDLILTAAHCIHPRTLGFSTQAQVTAATSVLFDSININANGGFEVQAANTLPISSFGNAGDDDIGLIWLAQPVTDRAPAIVNPGGDGTLAAKLDLVGFGENDAGNAGRLLFALGKSQTSCGQFGVSQADFLCLDQTSGAGICSGDSGGPAYATIDGVERVVGVTSFGDQGCQQLGAHYRVDSQGARAFLEANAPELFCQADGVCDETCDADVDCRVACEGDGDCAEGEYCDGTGACAAEPFSPGGVGSTCETGADCESGQCAAGGDVKYCVTTCEMGGDDCSSGFECTSAGDTGVCWPSDGDGGGCSASGGGGALGTLALLALAVLGLRRRA